MSEDQPRIMAWSIAIVVSVLIASYLLAMLLGPAVFFLTPAGLDFSITPVQPPIFLLFLFAFYAPFELNTGQLFMVSWIVFGLCFVLAWRLRRSFRDVIGKISSRPLTRVFDNWLFAMPIIASALLVAVTALIGLQDLLNVPTGSIPTPVTDAEVFRLYTDVSYAPLIEEIGFRITPIGAFFLVYLLLLKSFEKPVSLSSWQRFKILMFSFLYPDGAKSLVGERTVAINGLKGIGRGEWVLILGTSIIFGLAHVLSGIGWEIGKVTSAFVQGFVFAMVYVAYGFQAPILMHWFFNYYFYTYEVSATFYPNTLGISPWIEFTTIVLGTLSLVAFAILGIKRISNRRKTPQQNASVL